jgi:hypothetical protein
MLLQMRAEAGLQMVFGHDLGQRQGNARSADLLEDGLPHAQATVSHAEQAEYIAHMLGELEILAARAQCTTLSQLVGLAREEAILQRDRGRAAA